MTVRDAGLRLLVFVGALALAAPAAAQDGGSGGLDGGVPSGSDGGSAGGRDGGGGADGGSDGGTDAGTDGGPDAGTCTSDSDCPAPEEACREAYCDMGACHERDVSNGERCTGEHDLPECRQWECWSGECVAEDADDGTACDDEDACTTPDQCQDGVCEGAWDPEASGATECMCTWPEDPDGPGSFEEHDVAVGNVTELEVPLIDEVLCSFLGRPGGDIEIELSRSSSGGELEHPDDDGLGYCTAHAERSSDSGFEGQICGYGFYVTYSESDRLTRRECAECPDWAEGAPRPEGMCLENTGCEHVVHERSFGLGPLIGDETEFSIGIPRTNFTIQAGVEWELSTGGEISMTWDRSENHGGPDRDTVDCPECQHCYSRVVDFGPTFGFELQGSATLGIAHGRIKAEGGLTIAARRRDRMNSGSGADFDGWSAVEPAPEGACTPESCFTGTVNGGVDLTFRIGLASRENLRGRRGLGGGRFSGAISFLHLSCEGEYAREECDSESWEGSWECTTRHTRACEEHTCEERGYYCGQVRSECFDDLTIDCGECPASADPYNEKICIGPRHRMANGSTISVPGEPDRFSRACCTPRTCHEMYPSAPSAGSECVPPVPFNEVHFQGPGFGPEGAPGDGETYVHCGTFHDGCTDAWYERSLNCGECANNASAGITNNSCGGGGQPYGRCGCTADTEADACQPGSRGQAACGGRSDGCGGDLDCGACPDNQECGSNGLCCTTRFINVCRWEQGPPGYPRIGRSYPLRCGERPVRRCEGVTYDCGEVSDGFVCDDGEWACADGSRRCDSVEYMCSQCQPTPGNPNPAVYSHPVTGTSTLCRRSLCG